MAIFAKLGNYKNTGQLFLRIGLGALMIVHGYPKLLGGPDMWKQIGGSMANIGVHFAPTFWGFMAGASEAIGGALFLLGLWFRPACLFLMFTMIMAALHHFKAGQGLGQASHAIELAVVFFAMLFIGPGKYSMDKK